MTEVIDSIIIKMLSLIFLFVRELLATIDLNFEELRYVANHLTDEECRRLVAAIHFKAYMVPNALDEAEQRVPKDVSCLELLLRWNSAANEGKGETHEVLEHRLKQIGKYQLANWLGKTVFHQIGKDFEENIQDGLQDVAQEMEKKPKDLPMPPMEATASYDPTEWNNFDTICYTVVVVIITLIVVIICCSCFKFIARKCKNRTIAKQKMFYEALRETHSSSDSEDVIYETRL